MRHISLLILLAVTTSAAHYAPSRARPTLSCDCSTAGNTFPLNVAGLGGVNQGTLTESVACLVEVTLQICVASGNVIWTPSVACYATGEWSNVNSFSIDVPCQNNTTAFSNCSTTTSNYHSCSQPCPPQSYVAITMVGSIRDGQTPSSLLGSANKGFRCGHP
jgi:hypothetical protein